MHIRKPCLFAITLLSIMLNFIACGVNDSTNKPQNTSPANSESSAGQEEIITVPLEDTIMQYVKDTYPEFTIGEDLLITNQNLSGETIIIREHVQFIVTDSWELRQQDDYNKYYRYKSDSSSNFEICISNSSYSDSGDITEDEAIKWMKGEITYYVNSTNNNHHKLNYVSEVHINDYSGIHLNVTTMNGGTKEFIYVYIDGQKYTITLSYNSLNNSTEEVRQAALEMVGTITTN